jgi:DNA-binding NarL/FixJ family response regulator
MVKGNTLHTIWLIEDNEFYSHTIEDLINESGLFECAHSFGACEDALSALKEEIPPDVILLDIGLPRMNGVEGIGHIKSISPETFIIILTIHDDDENIFKALSAGASGYLLKNSTKERIIESIEEVLNGGAPMNAQIAKRVLQKFNSLTSPGADYELTVREKEVLRLLVDGNTKNKIAEMLFISYHTVDNHIRNIYSKLHVHSRTAVVAKALKERLF